MSNITLNTYSMYGAWFLLRLLQEGHNVDINYIGRTKDLYVLNSLEGILPSDNVKELKSVKDIPYNNTNLVLHDLTGKPKIAEDVVAQNIPILGDGNLNTEIEDNRILGLEVMEESDINVPAWEAFDNVEDAKKFIRKTNKTYVFKPSGGQDQDTASTYVSKNAEDLISYLDKLSNESKNVEFVLQEVVQGTEISTEAWFNGEDFYLINNTLEEKKFMNNNLGPNTGCSGNLVWVYTDTDNMPSNWPLIFREGLAKLKDFLQQYKYKGMIDLNTIVSDREIYGLEWTPRFGYDATATLFNLITSNLGDFLLAIASGAKPKYTTKNRFAASLRLSIPPYPSEIPGKHPLHVPINIGNNIALLDNTDIDQFLEFLSKSMYLYDVYADEDFNLLTAGISGLIGCPIYSGQGISDAFYGVDRIIESIQIPNMQYRTDLLDRISKRYITLASQGWLR